MKLHEILANKGPEIHTAKWNEPVSNAIQKLVIHNIGALAILDESKRLVGIFSERDILRLISKSAKDLAVRTISDYMTKSVITGHLDDEVEAAQAKMHNHRIRHLPVLDDNGLVGMISQGDLIKAQLDQVEFDNARMTEMITGKYPG